jgi:hypothetical protein
MKRILVLPILSFFGCSIVTTAPELGTRLVLPGSSYFFWSASTASGRTHETKFAGITYLVEVDKSNRLIYISTTDQNFRTPEGLGVGSTLEVLLAKGASQPIADAFGRFYTQLPSGWSAEITLGSGGTEPALQQSSKVIRYFKKKSPSSP